MKKLLFLLAFLALGHPAWAEDMGTVRMSGDFLDGNLLRVSVEVEAMAAPVLGAAYHLNYDESKLAFLRYEPGEFFERGGDPFYLVKDDEMAGKLIFGETLRRDDNFPMGDGQMVNFYFQILDESKFVFAFEHGVISTLDEVRQDLDQVNWEGLELEKSAGLSALGGFLKTQIVKPKNPWVVMGAMAVLAFGLLFLTMKFKKRRLKKT